jgi:hypothetical protein
MLCSDITYHHNAYGFSKKCTCHNAVHLTFGNISLLLSRTQIIDFSTYIRETLTTECCLADYDERAIYIPTRDFSMMFAMTYNELRLLYEILDHTLLMIEVEEALKCE